MTMRDLIPWGRNQQTTPSHSREESDPFMTLHREMNRLFDDVFRSFDLTPFGALSGMGPYHGLAERGGERDRQGSANLGRVAAWTRRMSRS